MDATKLLTLYREKTLSVLIIVVSLIVSANIYKSQTNKFNALGRVKDEEARKNTAIGKILETEKVFDSYRKVFKKTDINESINTITTIARECDITVNSIKPGKEETEQVYVRYPFALEVSASGYHNIGRFISKLENHSDICFVDSLNIKVPEVTGTARRFAAEMTLSTVGLRDTK
ncbi:MAG: type 4a pilus biogenesis protein PilO [Candidatus Omnitrophota bacterium]